MGYYRTIDTNQISSDGVRLTGSFSSTIHPPYSKETLQASTTVDARLLGNRFLFGTIIMVLDGKTVPGHLRGGLLAADAPFTGARPEMLARYAELNPKGKKK